MRFAASGMRVFLLATVVVAGQWIGASAAPIEWVTVGDAGNAADTTGYGGVAYDYRILKYEWTNAQYTTFLNAVDPQGTNPQSIWAADMGSDPRGGISNGGSGSGNHYVVRANMADKPVNFVSWWDAARVANWLQNGARTYATTDATAGAPQNTGAYALGTAVDGDAPAKTATARYWIPTENEWYKAAYYKGGSANAGYFLYGNSNNDSPIGIDVTADGTGTRWGISPWGQGNLVNGYSNAVWNGVVGNVATVGSAGAASSYGAFDMIGNVWEFNDLDGTSGSSRGWRGGGWPSYAIEMMATSRYTGSASVEWSTVGFRLAGTLETPVPEIDPAGLGSVMALVTGALGLLERRRAGRT